MQSDVCQLPHIPLIIGNVRGARQMLPHPNWKAEDQRGARARTSGGNNNDDDNQSGDMPSWMFNKDSKKKPAQIKKNDNRATQGVKSKKAPQKESVLLDQF